MTLPVDSPEEARLLIVDDDPATIRVLIHILKELGRIYFTTCGSEAMDLVRKVNPDLILLDIEMPEVSGFEVCASIKHEPAFTDIPILFVTSHDEAEVEAKALSMGGIDFIHKPPNPPVVQARVRNYLALKQRTDELRLLSTIDGLTGVDNRRAFNAAVNQEWRRACRTGSPLSLLMIDIDFFKRFNDTYGHQAGDDCLRTVAASLAAKAKRPGELTARFGGEEFAVLLPGCNENQAIRLAEIMRDAVANLAIPHSGSDVEDHVTVSIGVSSIATVCSLAHGAPRGEGICRFKDVCGLCCADLIKAADAALYDAKRGGRNRIAAARE